MKQGIFLLGFFLNLSLLWGEISEFNTFFLGEVKIHYTDKEDAQPFGLFLLKRHFSPEKNVFIDSCYLIAPEEGTFYFELISSLQEDPNEFLVSSPNSNLVGKGELIGSIWEWTKQKENMSFEGDDTVIIQVRNSMLENGTFSFSTQIYFQEGEFFNLFATFTSLLYPVSSEVIESLLGLGWKEKDHKRQGILEVNR